MFKCGSKKLNQTVCQQNNQSCKQLQASWESRANPLNTLDSFNYRIIHSELVNYLRFYGSFDGDSGFEKINLNPGKTLTIHLKGVRRVSFRGLYRFKKWLHPHIKIGCKVALIACSRSIVASAKDMSFGFRLVDHMQTFFAPYYCYKCDEEHMALINVKMQLKSKQPFKAPVQCCGSCGNKMELFEVEDIFLSFLRGAMVRRSSKKKTSNLGTV